MKNKVLAVIMILSLLLAVGCDKTSAQQSGSSSSSTVVKSMELAGKWHLSQMQLDIKTNSELSLLLKLSPGDEADGYFYLEKGGNVNFNITGNSLIYTSKAPDASGKITSDRFSINASQAQGTTYTLSFQNDYASQITVFLELIYPSSDSMYLPVKTD